MIRRIVTEPQKSATGAWGNDLLDMKAGGNVCMSVFAVPKGAFNRLYRPMLALPAPRIGAGNLGAGANRDQSDALDLAVKARGVLHGRSVLAQAVCVSRPGKGNVPQWSMI